MDVLVELMNITTPFASVKATDARNLVLGMRSAELAMSRSHLLLTIITQASNLGRGGSKNTPREIMSPPRPLTLSKRNHLP